MSKKLYALLVGINDYPPEVNDLSGSVNDVYHMQDYLRENFNDTLHLETLLNSDATRPNIIKLFREHLNKAGKDDVVLFHYSGHGSSEMSAPRFKEFFPDGMDETLVCYDSRRTGGYDLADKELAALLAEVDGNHPHIAVILDCCHAGSGTREMDDFKLGAVRMAPEWKPGTPRPIESYIGGYQDMPSLFIPQSKHVLMAACHRKQKAWETNHRSGVFTDTLIEVLQRTKGNIHYADLFFLCRSAVLKRALNQTPQFETYNRFMPFSKFLSWEGLLADTLASRARHHVFFDKEKWKIDCGALHGLPIESETKIEVALYSSPGAQQDNSIKEIIGYAEVLEVGPQDSILNEFVPPLQNANPTDQYKAEILRLPIPPMPVLLIGSDHDKKQVRDALAKDQSLNFFFPEEQFVSKYILSIKNGNYQIKHRESGPLLQVAQENPEASIQEIFSNLEHMVRWERKLALENPKTKLDTSRIDFRIIEMLDNGKFYKYERNDIILDYVKENGEWKHIKVKIQVRNRTTQELHFALCWFSPEYGIHSVSNAPIEPGQNWVTLYGEGEGDYIYLPDDVNQEIDLYKLYVSTQKVEDYLLIENDLEIGQNFIKNDPISENEINKNAQTRRPNLIPNVTHDWFTKFLSYSVVRVQSGISPQETSLANGKIIVKGHSSFHANISISCVKPLTRGIEQKTMANIFSDQGFPMIDLSGSRDSSAPGGTVLEMTDIHNIESLRKEPLVIVLDTPLKEDEFLLPITFDGEHFLPVGEFFKEENGSPAIRIHHIPETNPESIDPKRRSLGKALKLCFYKLVFGLNKTNQLCWVEYTPDNQVLRHPDNIKERVAKANNIILLVHGIIGDTKVMAEGLKLARDENNNSIADSYDLVLTYDYENLNTPINENALQLKDALKEVGIHEQQQKKITILAHSMGGLLCRWLIEQENGKQFVKHLVMAGTPNNGSVFGNISDYKNMATTALTLSLNFLRPLATHIGALLFVLNQTDKVFTSLIQMKENSTFIRDLDCTSDPHVKYTILAGDITHYTVDKLGLFPALMEKIKTSVGKLAYGDIPNDIAVSVASIKKVEEKRQPPPEKKDLVCHHLNYFNEATSLNALHKALMLRE